MKAIRIAEVPPPTVSIGDTIKQAIGLTVVQLLRRDGTRLFVRGIDMLDGTPVLDMKPYLSSVPQEQLRRGWLAEAEARSSKSKA